MKKNINSLSLFLVLAMSFVFNSAFSQVNSLSIDAFVAKIKATPKPQFLDVRSPDEWAQGKLASANCVNIQDAAFKAKVSKLNKAKPVFVYCAAGGRSTQASKILFELGFSKIYNLAGAGYKQLAEKGIK
jgi:phage shock protein E